MNLAQRTVLVVGAGLIIRLVVLWIVTDPMQGGWFGYAPDTRLLSTPTTRRFGPGLTTAILALAVIVWSAVALWLLASHAADRTDRPE